MRSVIQPSTKGLWSIIPFFCLLLTSCGGENTPTDDYISTRNAYIAEIERQGDAADEVGALADLERRLKAIIGSVQIEEFSKPAKSNLSTLFKEMGFGQLDGLRFDSDHESVVVTTQDLLARYLAENVRFPKAVADLARYEEFYLRALTENAAVNYYAEVPVSNPGQHSFAHAFVGLVSQDAGPFPPNGLFVLFTHGEYVFVAMIDLAPDVSAIQACHKEWEESEAMSDKAFVACYSRGFKEQAFFPELAARAQSIIVRLQQSVISKRSPDLT